MMTGMSHIQTSTISLKCYKDFEIKHILKLCHHFSGNNGSFKSWHNLFNQRSYYVTPSHPTTNITTKKIDLGVNVDYWQHSVTAHCLYMVKWIIYEEILWVRTNFLVLNEQCLVLDVFTKISPVL